MPRFRRAAIALLALISLFAIVGGTFAPTPAPVAEAPIAAAATSTASPAPSATLAPSATPIPVTPTLSRRPLALDARAKVAPTAFLPGSGPQLSGEQVAAGRRLDFYVGKNTFTPEQVAALSSDVEHALTYIQRRFQVYLSHRVSIGVYRAGSAPKRGVRGMAYTSNHTINVYYRPGEDQYKALVILSHELAHQLEAEYYGDAVQSRADTIIHEGLASWISGEYWISLSDSTSFQARARALLEAGNPLNVASAERSGPDVAYDIWAAFVDYLTSRYGWDAFHQLYQSSRGRAVGSADYKGVYGKTLAELNADWIATLR
jgi:hypothetical protein